MIDNKRGIAMIVSTLLIVLLVIVAVGIIWGVFRGTIEDSTGQFELGTKCLSINVKATSVTCSYSGTEQNCSVTYYREAGGDPIDGIRLIYGDGTSSLSNDISDNVEELTTNTDPAFNTTDLAGNVTSVLVAVYFNDASGDAQLCSGTSTFNDIKLVP